MVSFQLVTADKHVSFDYFVLFLTVWHYHETISIHYFLLSQK